MIHLNRQRLEPLVYGITQVTGHLAAAVLRRATIERASAPALLGATVSLAPRPLQIEVDVRGASFAHRQAILDALWRRLGGQLLEWVADDVPSRVLLVQLVGAQVTFDAPPFALPLCRVLLQFEAPDPRLTDLEPRCYALSTTPAPCPIGDAASPVRIYLHGGSPNVVDPVIVVRTHAGDEAARLTLQGLLSANDAWVIDSAAWTIDRYVAGVLQTGAEAGLTRLVGGTWPLLDPLDADDRRASWGSIALESASGTPTGLVTYTRRWM